MIGLQAHPLTSYLRRNGTLNKRLGNKILAGYSGKRILITGGRGYLASNMVNLLRDADCTIIRLVRTEAAFLPVISTAKIEDVIGDVRQRETWEHVLDGIDIVFHFAAQTDVYVANEDPLADLEVNVLPMLYLLEVCRHKGWQPVVLFSGTVTETGIPNSLPVDETHTDNPVTIYDLHKLKAEDYLKYYVRKGTVKGAVLRLSNVYGPGPKSSSPTRGIINQMIRSALVGKTLTVYGEGDCLRDYIYIEDVVRAFLEAAMNIEQLNGQHFVIGSGQGYTIAQAINLVSDRVALKTGKRVPVIHITPPSLQSPIETRDFVADSCRFHQVTGWKALYSFPEGIDRTIEAFS